MNGLLALEDDIYNLEDELLIMGLQMVVDGVEPDTIKEILELDLDTTERRHRAGQEVFEKWGRTGTSLWYVRYINRLDHHVV